MKISFSQYYLKSIKENKFKISKYIFTCNKVDKITFGLILNI